MDIDPFQQSIALIDTQPLHCCHGDVSAHNNYPLCFVVMIDTNRNVKHLHVCIYIHTS